MDGEKENTNVSPKKKNYFKKALKVILYVILVIIGLNVLLYILLSIPAIQQKVADYALEQLTQKLNTTVSVDKVRLRLFNNVNLQGIYIEDQKKDTLLYAQELDVSLDIWRLFDSELVITSVDLQNALVNVSQETPDSPFNFQFIIDAFASDTTAQEDTTGSALRVAINDVKISNTRLNYNVLSEPETRGRFNPSHISILDLNTNLDLSSIDMMDLDVTVNSLSLIEQSGFTVSNLEARALSRGTVIWTENLSLSLPNSSLETDSVRYNILTNAFTFIGRLSIAPRDVNAILPDINRLENNLSLQANAHGKLPEININQLNLTYGEDLILQANGYIENYERYDDSNINLAIDQLKATPLAITQIAQIADSTFTAPDIFSVIEYIRLKAYAGGTLKNLKLNAEAWTNQGSLQLDGTASIADTTFQNYRADVRLQTLGFNLAPFVGNDVGLGRIAMQANANAVSTNGNISAKASGVINSLQYDTLSLRNIKFAANYTPQKIEGQIDADLPIGKILAQGSMTQGNIPEISVNARVDSLMVNYFYTNPSWINPRLSLSLNGDIKGSSIDDMVGEVVIDSLRFWGDNFNYQPGRILLQSYIDEQQGRYIALTSSIVDATIRGEYQFTTLADELMNILNGYLPSMFERNNQIRSYNNNFSVDISVHNTEELTQLLALPVTVIEPVVIQANINTRDTLISIRGGVPFIKSGETEIRNVNIDIHNTNSSLNLEANAVMPMQNGKFIFDIKSEVASDSINANIAFRNDSAQMNINGELDAIAHLQMTNTGELNSYLRFSQTPINIGNLQLSFLPATVTNQGNRTTISNFGFLAGRGRMYNRYLGIDGAISEQPQDTLNISFENARLAYILRSFDINNISATVDGDIKLTQLLQQPEVYTDNLRIADIIIFGDTLGVLDVRSNFTQRQGAVNYNATLTNPGKNIRSAINGMYYTNTEEIDMNINLDRLSMKWLQPFVGDMLERVDGSVSSQIAITGKLDSPVADGWIGFNDMYVGVDITNVTYHISDTIAVLPDRIGFTNLVVRDNVNHTATVSAEITHQNFQNMNFDVNIDLNNFMVLNTANRTDSLYYGRVFASGNVNLKGNPEDIDIRMNIRNDRNSSINITIPETSEAGNYQSIVYINVPSEDSLGYNTFTPPQVSSPLPLNISAELAINPDISLGVIMNSDNPINMQMQGEGLIRFDYDMAADNMKAFGDYIIKGGTVRIRPQNIRTLEFRIEEGSKVNLVGDVMRTSFDITAYYRVNARLSSLDQGFSGVRIPVHCILGIKGNMNRMELTYDIELPDASDDIRQKVNSLISTDDQKIRQFANLILFGSFYSNTGITDNTNVLGSIASSTLSSGLDAIFGSVLGSNWEIGTNIEAGDGTLTDATVNVSTRLLDDRLRLSTNLGYRTDQTTTDETTFVGDFDIEYELSRVLKLRAFNHTNDRFYKQAPTTQGIGLVYTKEARTLKELFRFFSRKKKPNTIQTNNSDQSK